MGSVSFDGWLSQGTDKHEMAAKYLCFIVSITSINYSYTLMPFKSLWELQRSQSHEVLPVIESETDSIKIYLMPVGQYLTADEVDEPCLDLYTLS